jgi:hypothetical protein
MAVRGFDLRYLSTEREQRRGMKARDSATSLRRRGAAGAFALTVALLGACSAGGPDTDPVPTTTQADPVDVDETTPPSAESDDAAGVAEAAATKEVDYDGGRLRLDVSPVVRSGDLSRVTVTVTALRNPEGVETWFYYGVFTLFGSSAEEFQLLDLEGQQRYLTARDSEGECACTTDIHANGLLEGASIDIYAVFAAPPASVETVDLVMPGVAGTIADVPVE